MRRISLRRAYAEYNRKYFKNQLPRAMMVVWTRGMGSCMGLCEKDRIQINYDLRRWNPAWRSTLLHEMAHLATFSEAAQHGPRWESRMKRLIRQGAFKGLL